MTNKKIQFKCGKNTYTFELGKKRDLKGNTLITGYGNSMKGLKGIFDAITNKKYTEENLELIENLASIFGKTGTITGRAEEMDAKNDTLIITVNLDEEDLKLGDEFKYSGEDIETFLSKKLNNQNKEGFTSEDLAEMLNVAYQYTEESSNAKPNKEEKAQTKNQGKSTKTIQNESLNRAIQNRAKAISEDSLTDFTYQHTIKDRETLEGIARKSLEAESNSTITTQQVHKRIAEIVAKNNIKDINSIKAGTKIFIPEPASINSENSNSQKVTENTQNNAVKQDGQTGQTTQAGQTTQVEQVEPPSLSNAKGTETVSVENKDVPLQTTIKEKQPVGQKPSNKNTTSVVESESSITLTRNVDTSKFQSENVQNEDGVVHKFQKDGDNITEEFYEKEVNIFGGTFTLQAKTLEELKAQVDKVLEINNSYVKDAPEGETAEQKATRLSKNSKAIVDLLKATNYNIDAIKTSVDLAIYATWRRDSKDPALQAEIQQLLLTKDPEVLDELLLSEDNSSASSDVTWYDKKSFKIVANMFKAIKDKEYSGEALSDKELQLKEILKKGVVNGFQYEFDNIDTDGDNYSDLRLNMDGHGNICYLGELCENNGGMAVAGKKRENVENYTKDLRTARAEKEDGTYKTDVELKAEYKALYKKYADTKDDDSFACSVLAKASDMNADKDDILKAINNNGVEFLTCLKYSHLNNDEHKIVQYETLTRLVHLYTDEQKGEVKNMVFLPDVFDIIDKIDIDKKSEIKQLIIESYFDKKAIPATEEGGETTYEYTYTGRRMTAEEAKAFINATNNALGYDSGDNDYTKAVIKTLTLDDLGEGRLGYELEECNTNALKERFTELANYITEPDDMVRLIKNIWYSSNIPFDNLIEYFNPEENPCIIAPLLSRVDGADSISNENRNKLIDLITSTETGIKDVISSGVTYTNLLYLLPEEKAKDGNNPEVKWTEQAKKVFEQVLAKGTLDDLERLYNKANQSTDLRAKVIDEVKGRLETNSTDPEFIMDVVLYFGFDDSVKQAILDIDASKLEGDDSDKDKCMEKVFYMCFPKWEFVDETRYKIENNDTFEKAKQNNWLTKTTVGVGDSSSEYYRYDTKGGVLAEKWNSTNTDGNNTDNFKLVLYKDVLTYHNNKDGEIKAEKIIENDNNILGMTKNLLKYLDEDGYITKDNVVAFIYTFNRDAEMGIIDFLDSKIGGPSVAQMERIPKALVEAAKEAGLKEDVSPLKELVEFMNNPKRVEDGDKPEENDYASGKAITLDELMINVINKLEGDDK